MDHLGLHTLAHSTKPYGLPLAIGGADATPMESLRHTPPWCGRIFISRKRKRRWVAAPSRTQI